MRISMPGPSCIAKSARRRLDGFGGRPSLDKLGLARRIFHLFDMEGLLVAQIPLISNFEEDFVLQLIAVDTENTMDELAAAAAVHSVGRRVRRRSDHVVRVRRQGSADLLPRAQRISEAGIQPMECLDFVWEPVARAVS